MKSKNKRKNINSEKLENGDEKIIITVRYGDYKETRFKIGLEKKFKQVMKHFCKTNNLILETMRFMFDGVRIDSDMTPNSCEMVDGDVIDVMTEQTGGNK